MIVGSKFGFFPIIALSPRRNIATILIRREEDLAVRYDHKLAGRGLGGGGGYNGKHFEYFGTLSAIGKNLAVIVHCLYFSIFRSKVVLTKINCRFVLTSLINLNL